MRLLLDESLATMPVTEGVRGGLVAPGMEVEIRPGLKAADVGTEEAALIAAGEYGALQETHRLLPQLAVVFDKTGPVMMRTPIRPDEIEQSPIRLIDAGSSAELLARSTMNSFFGILPEGFLREGAAEAQVVVVEGVLAMNPPEAGFNEDLTRAWFILTSEAYVSHVLVIPVNATNAQRDQLSTMANAISAATVEQRREVRKRVAEATGLDRDLLTTLFQSTRWSLSADDRRALLMLLQLGNRSGEVGPYVPALQFSGEE